MQFASEIKALRASGCHEGELNWRTSAKFLLEGRLDNQGETFYEGIQQISAGSGFELTLDGAWHEWSILVARWPTSDCF